MDWVPNERLGDIFFTPVIIAVISCAGLISALVGDNVRDVLSWMTLSVPVAVAGWYAFRRRKPAKP